MIVIPGEESVLGLQEVWEGFDGVKELNFRSASAVLIGEFVQRRCICPMHIRHPVVLNNQNH